MKADLPRAEPLTPQHQPWLDVLRFVAALVVMAAHVRAAVFADYASLMPESRHPAVAIFFALTRLGHEAVIVFFVLSGYLVGGKAIERIRQRRFDANAYAIDRIARIWVPLIPALVLSVLVRHTDETVWSWLGNILGLQNVLVPVLGGNAPLWSLAYEIWFYVLVYAVGRMVMQRSVDPWSLVLLAAGVGVFSVLSVHYMLCWLIGAWFYVRPHRLPAWLSMGVGLGMMGLAVAGLQWSSAGAMGIEVRAVAFVRPVLEVMLAWGAGLLCVTLAGARGNMVSKLLAPLAAFSYTLYLSHYPLLGLLAPLGWSRMPLVDARSLGIYLLVIVVFVMVAWLLYLMFEQHTGRVRAAMKRRMVN